MTMLDELVNSGQNDNVSEEMFKFLKEFYDKKNLKQKTDLSKKEIKELINLNMYADAIKKFSPAFSKEIKINLLNEYYLLNISNKRQSRKEFFSIFNRIFSKEEDKEQSKLNIFRR